MAKIQSLGLTVNHDGARWLAVKGPDLPSKTTCGTPLLRCVRRGVLLCLLLFFPIRAAAQSYAVEQTVVMGLKFEGNESISSSVLSAAIGTTNSSWVSRTPPFKWLGMGEERGFNETEFRRDVLRLQTFYRASGFLEVVVDTVVEREPGSVSITFEITEGEPVVVQSLTTTGLEHIPQHENLLVDLPLRVGDPFNRYLMTATGDTIVGRLRNNGYPAAQVFRNFEVDREARLANVTLEFVPGTRAFIGTVRVEGTSPVDTSFVRRQLTTRYGRTFSQEALFESQRTLYQTDLFRTASVQIDSAEFSVGDTLVPLVVRVSSAPGHRIAGSVGYATTDCFRGGASWTKRNFLGGGKILTLSGKLSKIGAAPPLDAGFKKNVCGALEEDSIGARRVNYNVTASIRRPNFLNSSRNTATYTMYAERASEFKIYEREEVGASIGVLRRTSRRTPIQLTYQFSYGRTRASAANFCAFFNSCTAEDRGILQARQRLGTVSLQVNWPRVNTILNPTRGWQANAELTHSGVYFGSSELQRFTRFSADIAWYRTLSRGVVLSWRLRGGMIFAPTTDIGGNPVSFVPIEQRFYAGGPEDVRGYDRNELGPVVYVTEPIDGPSDSIRMEADSGRIPVRFAATGGNTLAVGNVELRIPSPIFGDNLRLAFFADAGGLWQRGSTDQSPILIRVTPGFGLRVGTPLGPARLDIAWNPYSRSPGALYHQTEDGQLINTGPGFEQDRPRSYTLHFSIGQAF